MSVIKIIMNGILNVIYLVNVIKLLFIKYFNVIVLGGVFMGVLIFLILVVIGI